MREKELEQKLIKEVRKRGGLCLKFVSPGFAGVPDRLLLMSRGRVAFVEVKRPGEVPRMLQKSRHRLLRKLGFKVYVLDHEDQIERIIGEMEGGV